MNCPCIRFAPLASQFGQYRESDRTEEDGHTHRKNDPAISGVAGEGIAVQRKARIVEGADGMEYRVPNSLAPVLKICNAIPDHKENSQEELKQKHGGGNSSDQAANVTK